VTAWKPRPIGRRPSAGAYGLLMIAALVVCVGRLGAAGAATPARDQQPQPRTVRLFLVALRDEGRSGTRVGCGDSLVAVTRALEGESTGAATPEAALAALLSIHDRGYGQSGLYNALAASRLRVGRVDVGTDGTAAVDLSGTLTMGGECDAPRIEAQLRETLMQFADVHAVSISVNGHPLSDVLSGR
jgi:hypothetical protein